MQTLLRCYCAESGFDQTSHLSMVRFYYNCSINEATSHSPFKVMHGFQPSTHAYRLIPLTGATADAGDRLTMIMDIKDVDDQQLIKLSKERMSARSTRTTPIFQPVVHSRFSGTKFPVQELRCVRAIRIVSGIVPSYERYSTYAYAA